MTKGALHFALPGIVAVSLGIAGCAAGPSGPETPAISAEEMRELYSEPRDIAWRATGGASGKAFSEPDGSLIGEFPSGREQGTWRIDGNEICTTYESLRGGRESCFTYHAVGDRVYEQYSGNRLVSVLTFSDRE